MPIPPARSPGFSVRDSRVSLPATAAPGSRIEGKAPPGSTVDAFGQQLTVPASGRFVLEVPADASGTASVGVERLGMTPLRLRLDITRPGH